MQTGVKDRFVAILRTTRDLAKLEYWALLCALLLLSAAVALTDLHGDMRLANLVGGLGSFVAAGVLTFRTLERIFPDNLTMTPRLNRLFGLNLLSSLAILAAGLLFVVPGVFLYLQWFIAWPALVHGQCGIIEALRTSWREMRGWRIAVLLYVLGLLLLTFLAFFLLLLAGLSIEKPSGFVSAFLFNFSVYLPLMLSYIAAVACYGLMKGVDLARNEG